MSSLSASLAPENGESKAAAAATDENGKGPAHGSETKIKDGTEDANEGKTASTKKQDTQEDAATAAAAAAPSVDLSALIPSVIQTSMSTSGLEYRLKQLREASTQHSQILTQKLASSQSGQNLLHMGTSLSTLPPDLHNLLQQLHPLVATVETAEQDQLQRLERLVQSASQVQQQARRVQQAQAAANVYADLLAAEGAVQQYQQQTRVRLNPRHSSNNNGEETERLVIGLDETAALERAAHITVCLLADLNVANEQLRNMTTASGATQQTTAAAAKNSGDGSARPATVPSLQKPLEDDTESAQFLMKLAPRIRRLESDTVQALLQAMEDLLLQVQEVRSGSISSGASNSAKTTPANNNNPNDAVEAKDGDDNAPDVSNTTKNGSSLVPSPSTNATTTETLEMDLLLMLGHCMRGLAMLGHGADVESIFARVAIMPLIRSKVSMGRLDEGGSRGECAGLFSLLDEMATVIQQTYGPVLSLGETMFYVEDNDAGAGMDVDLLTAGVWVPIATALMADTAIKMAIFSPGIASILQANYVALDTFLSELSSRLLEQQKNDKETDDGTTSDEPEDYSFLHKSTLPKHRIERAQDRIYSHPKTAEFSKRWNLPIYYQLRFGESCTRVNKAVDQTKRDGWIALVFSGSEERAEELKSQIGFELTLFLELYDILTDLWRPDVILKPLTNRFLRGAVQLVGRTVTFISESMEGKIKFGQEPKAPASGDDDNGETNSEHLYPTRAPYCWGDSEDDVAAVAWELTILESSIRHDYVDTVCDALQPSDGSADAAAASAELKSLVSDVLREASDQIHPIIDKAWNEIIVKLLTVKCSAPLSAVKGVAVMYRMTNRPPPTQPSSFVATIFRPLKEFTKAFTNRMPEHIGAKWKQQIVVTVSDRYAVAVDELLTTVQRTEVALKNRKARRVAAGGMSDGEKLKLQLYLDYKAFFQSVREVGVDPATVTGLSKLKKLTSEGESLYSRQQNGT